MRRALIWLAFGRLIAQPAFEPRYLSLDEAAPILRALGDTLPDPARNASRDAKEWDRWVRASDAGIRARLDRGQEDTISNLLRFGVTYTSEYRIDDEYLPRYGESSLVNSFAEHRAADLIRALADPKAPPGLAETRAFLEARGYPVKTAQDRQRLKKYLLDNLARLRDDFLKARDAAKMDREHMFADRGISLDTNLWPDYDLHVQLRTMKENNVLEPKSVHRVAIVGPGLDYVNKQEGLDLYAPQTTQPFAVLDSLLRLGLAADDVEIYTIDISSRINLHLESARKRAAAGGSYTIQLPWFDMPRLTDSFRTSFVDYWRQLGASIGEEVEAVPIPSTLERIETRAVRVDAAKVLRVTPIDANIVFQALKPDPQFDLVIGTNIFLYYGEFEQALARANIARMMRPGGYLLSNDKLSEKVSSRLELISTTEIPMTTPPVITDFIHCYRAWLPVAVPIARK
jgi:hypothetical protein